MSQTVRIDWKRILSWVRVSVRPSNFLYAKNTHNYREYRVARTNVYLNVKTAATGHYSPVTAGRSPATTYMSGGNSDYSGVRLSQNGKMQQVKTATTRDYTLTAWKMWLRKILLRSLRVCIVHVKINNEELFFKCFPVRKFMNIILFLDL